MLVGEIFNQFFLNPNVNADFLHQDTASETIVLLVLLEAEKQNLF